MTPTRVLATLLANAAAFAVAAALLDGFDVHPGGFVVAVLLFTVLAVALRRTTRSLAPGLARQSAVLGGLALTAVALVLTDVVAPADGFELEGPVAWVVVVLLVWAAGVAFGELDAEAPADVPPVGRG